MNQTNTNDDNTTITNNNTTTPQLPHSQHSEEFYNAIINNDINWLTIFFNDSDKSILYSTFKYKLDCHYLPPQSFVTPIIIAIINNKLSIVQLLIQQYNNIISSIQFDPLTYKENGTPLFFYAIASESNEMMDYIFSLYSTSTTTSQSTSNPTNSIQSSTVAINTTQLAANVPIPVTTPPTDQLPTQQLTFNLDTIIAHDDLYTPLQFAIRYFKLNQIQYLIERFNCDPLKIGLYQSTILHLVARAHYHSIEMVVYLLSLNGVKELLKHQNQFGMSALLSLAYNNRSHSFQYLIEKYGASLQYQGNGDTSDDDDDDFNEGDTVAHAFAQNGNIEMINYIYTIDSTLIFQPNRHGHSPFFVAISNNHLLLVQHFIQHYQVDINQFTTRGSNALHMATSSNQCSIELIDYIINLNPKLIEKRNHSGRTPLCVACQNGIIDIVLHLINTYHANAFVLDRKRYNLMHYAIDSGNIEMVKCISRIYETSTCSSIINHNNDDDNSDGDNDDGDNDDDESDDNNLKLPNGYCRLTGDWFDHLMSPIEYTIECCQLDALKQLIRLKANITLSKRINNKTILQYAFDCAHQLKDCSIFEYLLSDECLKDWNSEELKFNDDETTISIYGQKDPIQPQLEIPSKSKHSISLLLQSASHCNLKIIQLLVERGANIYSVDIHNNNILHKLFRHGQLTKSTELAIINIINYIFSLSTTDKTIFLTQRATLFGYTPLLVAAQHTSFPIVQRLIEIGSDINDIDGVNNYILYYAASNSQLAMVSQIIQHYPQHIPHQLYQINKIGYSPFFCSIDVIKKNPKLKHHSNININEINTIKNFNIIDYDFYNQDINAFIQYDPKVLFQRSGHVSKSKTILHAVILTEDELPLRLVGLIEAVIYNIDIAF